MMEKVSACPLCARADHVLFDRRDFRGRRVENRLCRYCGLVFQSPRMTQPELEQFYADEYRSLYQGGAGPSEKDLKVQRGRAAALLAFLDGKVASIRRHLDIGSSSGILMQIFENTYHAEMAGVEPGDSYRHYARDQGLLVYPSLEMLQPSKDEKFDLVTMAHVLEHLPDPVAYLRELRESYLDAGGWLLLEVPNLYAHDSFEVAHLTAFSAHTLQQVVRRAGFQVAALIKHGLPRSHLLPLYLTLLARPSRSPDPPALRPEHYVAAKRRLGMFRRRLLTRLFPKLAWVPV
jgi:2-polyprenyl-3-methyl-5-hydroxy-6-metoxy-1,4-benzoquinol methylase